MVTPKERPFILEGYIDLAYWKGPQLIVRDHKTTGKPGNFRKKGETEYDMQQATYIGGLRQIVDEEGKQLFPVFRGEVTELVTFNYKDFTAVPIDKVMRRTPTFRADRAIAAAMDWYGNVVDQMIEEEVFLRSLENGCKYCWYKEPCILSSQGVDDGPILSVAFRKKSDERRPTAT